MPALLAARVAVQRVKPPFVVLTTHLAAPVPVRLPANAAATAESGPGSWDLALTWETWMGLQPGLVLAIGPFGEWTSGWTFSVSVSLS